MKEYMFIIKLKTNARAGNFPNFPSVIHSGGKQQFAIENKKLEPI